MAMNSRSINVDTSKLPAKLLDFIRQCEAAITNGAALRIPEAEFVKFGLEPHRQEEATDKMLTAMGIPNRLVIMDLWQKQRQLTVTLDAYKRMVIDQISGSGTLRGMLGSTKIIDWVDPDGE